MADNANCILAKIAREEIPAHIFYRNKEYLAILDVNPILPGHSLILPRRNITTIHDLDDEQKKWLGISIYDVSQILASEFGPDISILNTSGKGASQSIEYFHIHLIPRYVGDRLWDGDKSRMVTDRSSDFPRMSPNPAELVELCAKLKNHYDAMR